MSNRLSRGMTIVFMLWTVLLPGCGGGTATRNSIDDAAMTARIKTVLLNDAAIAATQIDVDIAQGVVTMSGTVSSAREEERAIQLVRGVSGVRDVRSALAISPPRP